MVSSSRTSSAADAREKLLLTQNSHAVWDVEAQANTFRVSAARTRRMNSKQPSSHHRGGPGSTQVIARSKGGIKQQPRDCGQWSSGVVEL